MQLKLQNVWGSKCTVFSETQKKNALLLGRQSTWSMAMWSYWKLEE